MTETSDRRLEDDEMIELLATEYQEAGQEARSKDNLIHNSYYLVLFSLGIFVVGALDLFSGGNILATIILLLIGSAVFAFLFVVILTHTSYRASVWSRRRQVEQMVHEIDQGIFLIQKNSVTQRLPPGNDEPRDFTFLEGLSTKWVSYLSLALSIAFLFTAILVSVYWIACTTII